jgi:hypothetical protein
MSLQTLEIKTGYVYLLKSNLLGGYKIGITTNPASRFKALAVGTKATLIGYWKLDAYRELEKQLHTEYKDARVPQSEWFDLNSTQVRDVIQKITSISDIEFLMPEFAQSFLGPQYLIKHVAPYEQGTYSRWTWFGVTALLTLTGVLIGLSL